MKCARRMTASGRTKISGRYPQNPPSAWVSSCAHSSVVLEWLKKKQVEGVEKGWKEGKAAEAS
jgi:hypothetical protein